MKTLFVLTMITGLFGSVKAQYHKEPYWVVEGNINNPTYMIIRYYDRNNFLVMEDTIQGKFIDIRKKRNRDLLDRRLAMVNQPMNDVVKRLTKK